MSVDTEAVISEVDAVGDEMDIPADIERPRKRGDCIDGPRPCPWASCRHHLYLDVSEATGHVKTNRAVSEPWEMAETCALDVAERDGQTLEQVSQILGMTRERVRQIEAVAILGLRSRGVKLGGLLDRGDVTRGPQTEEKGNFVPTGYLNLPPPPPRALFRCRICGVRTNEPDRAGHLARHGVSGDPDEHFTPDDSVARIQRVRPTDGHAANIAAAKRRSEEMTMQATMTEEEADDFEDPDPFRTDEAEDDAEDDAPAPPATRRESVREDADWIATTEAVRVCGCHPTHLGALARKGKLARRPSGNGFFYRRDQIEELRAKRSRTLQGLTKEPEPTEETAETIERAQRAPIASPEVDPGRGLLVKCGLLVRCGLLGALTPVEALERVATLMGVEC